MRFELITDTLDPVLQAYVDSTDRVNIIRGPLGSGKTFGSCQKIFSFMCAQKPNQQGIRKSRWVAIRNTFPDLLTTTVKDWMELFGELGTYKAGGISPPSHILRFRLKDKSLVHAELIFIALDRPLAIKKLRGTQVTGFWLNEIKELDKAIIDMADFRHGRYPSAMDGGPSWHGIIGDTNSPDDDHWLYEMAEETKPEGWAFFDQPGGLKRELIETGVNAETGEAVQEWTGKWIYNEEAENVHNLPGERLYYLNGQEGKDNAWIAVNLANEFGTVHDGNPIYAEQWLDEIHTSSTIELIEGEDIVIGMDFGLTPAAIIGQEAPNGRLLILDELVSEGMGINQFATEVLLPKLRADYKDNTWIFVGDPAGNKRSETDEQTCFKELAECGIDAEPANSNDPLIRWEAVRYFLTQMRGGKPAFALHPRCKVVRKGFNGGYKLRRIQQAGTNKYSSKADKNKFSHPHDGLQYLCMHIKGDTGDSNNDFERPEAERWSN